MHPRCLGESLSHKLFVEKALTGPCWKHIEVQIIGDGTGAVNHFWERECSVQRRYVVYLFHGRKVDFMFKIPESRRSMSLSVSKN